MNATATGYTAIRTDYNRSTKTYDVTARADADPMMVHGGWMVYPAGDEAAILERIKGGGMIAGVWKPAAVGVVVAHLEAVLGLPASGWMPAAPVKAVRAEKPVAAPKPEVAPVAADATVYPVRGSRLISLPAIGDTVRYSTCAWGVKVGTVVELSGTRVRVKWDRMELTNGRTRTDGKRTWVNVKSLCK